MNMNSKDLQHCNRVIDSEPEVLMKVKSYEFEKKIQ